jgi:hypothetical protein
VQESGIKLRVFSCALLGSILSGLRHRSALDAAAEKADMQRSRFGLSKPYNDRPCQETGGLERYNDRRIPRPWAASMTVILRKAETA